IDQEGAVDVFQSRSLALEGRIRLGAGRRPLAAAIAPDGRSLAVSDVDGRVQFWDLGTRKPLGAATYAHAYDATSVAYSADGRWLVTGGFDSTERLWDAHRRSTRNTAGISNAADLSLNPQGTLLAITLGD